MFACVHKCACKRKRDICCPFATKQATGPLGHVYVRDILCSIRRSPGRKKGQPVVLQHGIKSCVCALTMMGSGT